jgi:transcriptional regulator of acetoin/glycerol metabolism
MLTDGDRICVADLPGYLWEGEIAAAQPEDQFDPENDVAGAAELVLDPTEAEQPSAPMTEPLNTTLAASDAHEERPLLLDEVIKKTLVRSLEETEGNRRLAAHLLGIPRSTLYRMLARYGLEATGRLSAPALNVGGTPR